jgi:hypothetical protein
LESDQKPLPHVLAGSSNTTHTMQSPLTRVRGTPAVPQLAEKDSTLVMYRLDDGAPCVQLLRAPDAGGARVAYGGGADISALRNEQRALARALTIYDYKSFNTRS